MNNPLFAITAQANCGCRWSAVSGRNSADENELVAILTTISRAMVAHGTTTGHTVDFKMVVRPINFVKGE